MTNRQSVRIKRAFLESFAVTGNITESCAAVGLTSRTTVYKWQEHDEAFSAAFREAELQSTERLEAEARRRAADGVEEAVYHQGVAVGTVRKYSDVLLIFLLKARNPGKYRDRVQMQHADAEGQKLPLGAVEEFVRGALAGG